MHESVKSAPAICARNKDARAMATAFSGTVSPTHSVPSVVVPAAEAEPPPAADEGVETERGSHSILDGFCTLAGYAGKQMNHG